MKSTYRTVCLLILAGALLPVLPGALLANASAGSPAPARHSAQSSHAAPGVAAWRQRDTATYVVSTLNLPRCPNGQVLSRVLWGHDGARHFDVLKSTSRPELYFVQARSARGHVLAIYAYKFGRVLPVGISRAQCVRPAPSAIRAMYHSRLVPVMR